MNARTATLGGLLAACLADPAMAGAADVIDVSATRTGDGWRFDVTVAHADEGWEHYADEWRVLGPHGDVLGVRDLAHPHVDEQPFTRSLSGVAVPDGIRAVTVEARDSVHGRGGATMTVPLPE